jgi:hypothetical protein
MTKINPPVSSVPDANDVDSGAIEMTKITPTLPDATKAATEAATDAVSGAIEMAKFTPTGLAASKAASLVANSGLVPPVNVNLNLDNIKSKSQALLNKIPDK